MKPYHLMKAPGDKRPTWGEGIIQICITRACDLSCTNCTQGSHLAGKPMMMLPAEFAIACESLIGYTGVIGLFGGNPTIHPEFESIARIMQRIIPFEQRGLWSNNLNGYGKLCREIFNPEVSNLNVHTSHEAMIEMLRDWPESHPKGYADSRHSPPYVAMIDMLDMTQTERWALINNCDINQLWSAMIGIHRGELRAWFCELAGAQSMLHENEIEYDTGIRLFPGWWRLSLDYFESQIYQHCFRCGVPLRGIGDLAVAGKTEQVSATHANIYKLKRPKGKVIQIIRNRSELGGAVQTATNYIENGLEYPEVKE